MASNLPRQNVFLTPRTAAAVISISERRDIPVAAILRAAVVHGCANPLLARRAVPAGRTFRTWFYCSVEMKAALKLISHQDSVPMSKWIAGAVESFVEELLRDQAGMPASPALLRTREAVTPLLAGA